MNRRINLYAIEVDSLTFWLGLIGGLLFGLGLYLFLYICWESLMFFSNALRNSSFTLSGVQLTFFRFFLAFISLNHGLSVCLTIWTGNLRQQNRKGFKSRSRYFNDHRMLTWSFLSWFVRGSSIYLVAFNASGVFGAIDWYAEYWYLFILFMLVLFLQNWTWMGYVHQVKKWRLLGVSFMAILCLSSALAYVQLPVFKAVHIQLKDADIINNSHQFHTVESSSGDRIRRRSESDFMAYLIPKGDTTLLPQLFEYRAPHYHPRSLDTLPELVAYWKVAVPSYVRERLRVNLLIDERVLLKQATNLIRKIGKEGIYRFGFAVHTPGERFNPDPWDFLYIENRFRLYTPEGLPTIPEPEFQGEEISIMKGGLYRFDEQVLSLKSLKDSLMAAYEREMSPPFLISVRREDGARFGDFLKLDIMLSELRKSIREEMALKLFAKAFDDLNQDQSITVSELASIKIYYQFIYSDED